MLVVVYDHFRIFWIELSCACRYKNKCYWGVFQRCNEYSFQFLTNPLFGRQRYLFWKWKWRYVVLVLALWLVVSGIFEHNKWYPDWSHHVDVGVLWIADIVKKQDPYFVDMIMAIWRFGEIELFGSCIVQ